MDENVIVFFLNENFVGEEFIFIIRINLYNFRFIFFGIIIIEIYRKDFVINSVL